MYGKAEKHRKKKGTNKGSARVIEEWQPHCPVFQVNIFRAFLLIMIRDHHCKEKCFTEYCPRYCTHFDADVDSVATAEKQLCQG